MCISYLSRNKTSSLVHRKHYKGLLTLVPTVHISKDFDFRLMHGSPLFVNDVFLNHISFFFFFFFFKRDTRSVLWFQFVFHTLFVPYCLETYTRCWQISFVHTLLNLETYPCFSGTYSSVIFFSWFFLLNLISL